MDLRPGSNSYLMVSSEFGSLLVSHNSIGIMKLDKAFPCETGNVIRGDQNVSALLP